MSAERRLTGRHALMIFGGMFAIIIGANAALVYSALSTFPGVTERNGYVASQDFDRRSAAQRALGWQGAADYGAGRLAVRMTGSDGKPLSGLDVSVVVGLPATAARDRRLVLTWNDGLYDAAVALDPGGWLVDIRATDARGRSYEASTTIRVAGAG